MLHLGAQDKRKENKSICQKKKKKKNACVQTPEYEQSIHYV